MYILAFKFICSLSLPLPPSHCFPQYDTDFYILDKYPLSVRPFYTMPDPNNSVCGHLTNYINKYTTVFYTLSAEKTSFRFVLSDSCLGLHVHISDL